MLSDNFDELIDALEKAREFHLHTIEKISHEILACYKGGGKILIFGNGGSFADAIHFAAELEGAYKNRTRPPLAALVPSNPSTVTAIANDFGYDSTFLKFVQAHARPRDVVIGFSTSGNSPNVLDALIEANQIGATTVAFTGSSGGKLKGIANILFNAPSDNTPRIQEVHQFAYHEICGIVEKSLFG